ncbi:hypothetical protein JP75_17190 [Devosia riboflavina]|uniref:Transposase n=1 Tax=Devosia riboflavina TaxID=46914 RepID=A0A087M096_9HYPH|nr:hypothetical protein [Devosia riboflavina]KFL30299.1 hypothetical protein JP75_17190 [Devosia riboflavina]
MKANTHPIDEARLGIMLNELRLPTIKTLWPRFTVRTQPAFTSAASTAEVVHHPSSIKGWPLTSPMR